jgi:hypothetical protein
MKLSSKYFDMQDVAVRNNKLKIIPGCNISVEDFQLSFALNLSGVK